MKITLPSKLMDWGGNGCTVEKSVKIKNGCRASRAHVFIKATTGQKNVYIPFKMECVRRGYNNSSCQFRKRWCYWQLASEKCVLRRYLRRKGQRCLCTCLWVCALRLLMVNYVCELALQIKVLSLKQGKILKLTQGWTHKTSEKSRIYNKQIAKEWNAPLSLTFGA